MSEAEWLACTDPSKKFAILRGKRKLRLFAICCCHRLIPLFPELRACVEAADHFVDGQIGRRRLRAVWNDYFHRQALYGYLSPDWNAWQAVNALMQNYCLKHRPRPWWGIDAAISAVVAATCRWWWLRKRRATRRAEEFAQCQFLDDIFGNPFRPVSLDPSWFTPKVVELAQTIYDDRAFDRLPILAGALEDAGCTNADVLAHCRGPGPHVRGCWVVDLILAKD